MTPTRLDEADLGIHEGSHGAPQEVGGRHEVGVENGEERRGRQLRAMGEGAGLESGPERAPDLHDTHPPVSPGRHLHGDNPDGVVIGVVEDLDQELFRRPLDARRGVYDAFGHVALVVDGQLNRHVGLLPGSNGERRPVRQA